MKVLISAAANAGDRTKKDAHDFHSTSEGDLLGIPLLVCEGPASHRKKCGCDRSFVGLTGGSCTVGTVVEMAAHEADLALVAYSDVIADAWNLDRDVEADRKLIAGSIAEVRQLWSSAENAPVGSTVRIKSTPSRYAIDILGPAPASAAPVVRTESDDRVAIVGTLEHDGVPVEIARWDDSPTLYPLTTCCSASGKGSGDVGSGVVCRACYAEVDPFFGGAWDIDAPPAGFSPIVHDSITPDINAADEAEEANTMTTTTTPTKAERDAEILNRRTAGESVKDIAADLSISQTAVRDAAKRAQQRENAERRAEHIGGKVLADGTIVVPDEPISADDIAEATDTDPGADVQIKDEGDFLFLFPLTDAGTERIKAVTGTDPSERKASFANDFGALADAFDGLRVCDDIGVLINLPQTTDALMGPLMADPPNAYKLLADMDDETLERVGAIARRGRQTKPRKTIVDAVEFEQRKRSTPEPVVEASAAPAERKPRQRKTPSGNNRRRTFTSSAGIENDALTEGGPSFKEMAERMSAAQKKAEGSKRGSDAEIERDALIAAERAAGWSFNDLSDALGRADNGTFPFRRLAAHNKRKEG